MINRLLVITFLINLIILKDLLASDVDDDDILLRLPRLKGARKSKRKMVQRLDIESGRSTRWPNNTIVYEFNSSPGSEISERVRMRFMKAIKHWEQHTCIKINPYDPIKHANYLTRVIVSKRDRCASEVGYAYPAVENQPPSNIHLGDICRTGNIIHELGHLIGFRHEHNRPDRDLHININPTIMNRSEGDYLNYRSYEDTETYGVPYDLSSIMHYGPSNLDAKDPKRKFLMGQRIELSFLDKKMANMALNCSASCNQSDMCQNGGYLGKDCKCICPESLIGSLCQTLIPFKKNNPQIDLDAFQKGSLSCNFTKESLCNWHVDQARSTILTVFFSAPNPDRQFSIDQIITRKDLYKFDQLTRPEVVNQRDSSYIYMKSDQRYARNTMLISTPRIQSTEKTTAYLKFWYIMYEKMDGNQSASLTNISVNLMFKDGRIENLWFNSGNQGSQWKFVELKIDLPVAEFSVFFQLSENNNALVTSFIAIDKLEFEKDLLTSNMPSVEAESTAIPSVNGKWSDWSPWSRCIGICHSSIQYRTRVCPSRLTGRCQPGSNSEVRPCPNRCRVRRDSSNVNAISDMLKNSSQVHLDVSSVLKEPNGLSDCGGLYELSSYGMQFLTSPNFLKQYPRAIECYYLIKVDEGKRLNVKVNALDIQKYQSTGACMDKLEFRYYDLGQPGPVVCGKSQRFSLQSTANFMLIIFKTDWVQARPSTGFILEINVF